MWTPGRQGSGYKKLKLFELKWPFGMDGYILRYDSGDYIPKHKDPVLNKRHYRLNLIFWNSGTGGEFICDKKIVDLSFIKIFRPDLYEHELTPVVNGCRLVLSLGVAI